MESVAKLDPRRGQFARIPSCRTADSVSRGAENRPTKTGIGPVAGGRAQTGLRNNGFYANHKEATMGFFLAARWPILSTVVFAVVVGFLYPIKMQKTCPFPESLAWGFDKCVHVAAFAVLGAVLFLVLSRPQTRPIWWVLWQTAIVGVGLGFLTEVLQPIVKRTCDPVDLLADCIGIVAGSMLAWGISCLYVRKKRMRTKSAGDTA